MDTPNIKKIIVQGKIERILDDLEPKLKKAYGDGFKFRSYQKKSIKKIHFPLKFYQKRENFCLFLCCLLTVTDRY